MKKLIIYFEDSTKKEIVLNPEERVNCSTFLKNVGANNIMIHTKKEITTDTLIVFSLRKMFEDISKKEILAVEYRIDENLIVYSDKVNEVKYNIFDTLQSNEKEDMTILNETISFYIK